MPYKVINIGGTKYKLWNLNKRQFAPIVFNSKESALNQGVNWMRYRREQPVIVGNKIININKN